MRVAVDTRGKRADSGQRHARRQRERSGLSWQGISNEDAGDNDHGGGAHVGRDSHDAPECAARDTCEHDPERHTGADRNDELCAFHNFTGRMRARHHAPRLNEHAAGNGLSAFAPQPAISRPAPELAHSAPRLNRGGKRRQSCVPGLLILSGAAMLVLAAGSALAQSGYGDGRYGNGPPESTPGEMQQTDQLNQQAVSGTTQSPGAPNGEQAAPQVGPANDEGAAPDTQSRSTSQAQYDAQQDQYQGQMQQYRDQQQRYRADRDRYSQNLRDWDLAQYAWYYPHAYTYRFGDEYGLQPLYLIAEPSQRLAQLPVEGPGGRWVGRVRNVDIAPDGRPSRIEIALNRRVSVWVRPGDLRFDPQYRILDTDLSREDLWNMPGATIESGPY